METSESVPKRRRKAVLKDESSDDRTRKCTIVLDVDVDEKLCIAARRRRMTRSDIINEAIKKELREIVISIRPVKTDESGAAA